MNNLTFFLVSQVLALPSLRDCHVALMFPTVSVLLCQRLVLVIIVVQFFHGPVNLLYNVHVFSFQSKLPRSYPLRGIFSVEGSSGWFPSRRAAIN